MLKYSFLYVLDFRVARIFLKETQVFEGDNVHVKCAVFDNTHKSLHIYLCKNGIGVIMDATEQNEVLFTLRLVRREDSGNYSCVYSIKKYPPKHASSTNASLVIIQVQGNVPCQFKPTEGCFIFLVTFL